MRRTYFLGALAVLLLTATLMSSPGPAFSASALPTFRVADMYQATHPIYLGSIKWWIEQMEARSQGRFKAQWFGNSTLVAAPDIAKAVIGGTAHIGNCLYASPLVPIQDVVALPGAFEDKQLVPATKAYSRIVKKGLINEHYEKLGLKILFGFTVTNYQIFTTKKPVETLDALQGVKIRTAGTVLPESISALKGVPVNMAAGEATDAMQKGVIEGIATGIPSLRPYPYYDLIRFANIGFSLGGFPVIYAMNMKIWESLPPDIRDLINQVNEEAPPHAADFYLDNIQKEVEIFKKKGIKISSLTTAEVAQIRSLMAPIWKKWADSVEAKGSPGKRIVEDFKNALRQEGMAVQ